jgi:hypothetical protein
MFNSYARATARVFKIGGAFQKEGRREKEGTVPGRIIEALTSEGIEVPELFLLTKDHKVMKEGEGPQKRPVVGAKEGPSVRLSNIVSKILTEVVEAEENKLECNSTEDMKHEIERQNEKIVKEEVDRKREEEKGGEEEKERKNRVIGSLDVKALYPSCESRRSAEMMRRVIEESEIDIEIDDIELSRFVAVELTEEEIMKEGLTDVVHVVKKGEKKPRMIDPEMVGGEQFREARSKFEKPKRRPSSVEIRKMIGIVMEILVRKIMENHLYSFNGKIMEQKEGGPIGLELTGALARLVMMWWERKMMEKMRRLKIVIELYKRYIDDMNVLTEVNRNKKLDEEGELIEKTVQEIEEEIEKEDDELTMELIREIADSIEPMIKTEADYPSKHENKMLPILDLQVKMEDLEMEVSVEKKRIVVEEEETNNEVEIEREREKEKIEVEMEIVKIKPRIIWFEFYKKNMAQKRTILENSAMPDAMKRVTLTQEILRRFLNCKKEIPWKEKKKHVEEYMQELKDSGYGEEFRRSILKSAVEGYEKIVKDDENGVKKMYRSKDERKTDRWRDKRKKKKNWAGEKYAGVIFVPCTPGGMLKKLMQKTEEEGRRGGREKMAIKVVERAGRPLGGELTRKKLKKKEECGDKTCVLCKEEGRKKISCRKACVGYEAWCRICRERKEAGEKRRKEAKERGEQLREREEEREREGEQDAIYIGETGKGGRNRFKLHQSEYRGGNQEKSAFFKHIVNEHPEITPQNFETHFGCRIVRQFQTPIDRLVDEGIRMPIVKGVLLNSKMQWYQASLVRVTINTGGAEVLSGGEEGRGGDNRGRGGRGGGGGGRGGRGGRGG